MMANGRLLRALDNLAGEAGRAIEESRQFQLAQNQRLTALAQMKEKQDREFELEEEKLNLNREQVKIARDRLNFEQGLAGDDSDLNKLETQVKMMELQKRENDLKRGISDKQFENTIKAMESLNEAFTSGAPEQVIDEQQRFISMMIERQTGEQFLTEDIDFTAEREAVKENFAATPEGAKLRLSMQKFVQSLSKDFETINDNMNNIEVSLSLMEKDPNMDLGAISEAAITSFKKILDPRSVVREPEYDRTPENESILRRARGALIKILKGGGGLTPEGLKEIRTVARAMFEIRRQILNKKLDQQVRGPAKQQGFNPDVVAPLFEPITGTTASTPPSIQNPGTPGGNQTGNTRDFLKKQGLIR